MSESLRGRKPKEMTHLNTSSPWGSKVPLEFQKGLWQLETPRIKRFLEEERMEGEKESVLSSDEEERIGEAYTLRNESEEELFREMFTLT